MFFPSLFLTGAPPRGGSALTFLCWPSSFQRTLANSPRFSAPRSFRLRVQKYYIFHYLQQLFSLFFKLFPFALIVREINFTFFAKTIAWRGFFCGKCGFRGLPRGRFTPFPSRFHAFPAEIRASFSASMPLRGGKGRTRLGSFLKGTLLYICEDVPVGCACRTCLPDVPVGRACRDAATHACGVHGYQGSVFQTLWTIQGLQVL